MIGIRWGAVIGLGVLAGTLTWAGWNTVHHVWVDHREGHVVRERVQALWDLELRRAQAAQPPAAATAPAAP